jgi:hypothetical protein
MNTGADEHISSESEDSMRFGDEFINDFGEVGD